MMTNKLLILILFFLMISFQNGTCKNDTIYVIREQKLNKIEKDISEFEKTLHEQEIKQVVVTGDVKTNRELLEEKDKDIERIFNLIIAVIGLIGILIGFIIWDRKTSDKPFTKQLNSLKTELQQMKGENQKLKDTLDEIKIPE